MKLLNQFDFSAYPQKQNLVTIDVYNSATKAYEKINVVKTTKVTVFNQATKQLQQIDVVEEKNLNRRCTLSVGVAGGGRIFVTSANAGTAQAPQWRWSIGKAMRDVVSSAAQPVQSNAVIQNNAAPAPVETVSGPGAQNIIDEINAPAPTEPTYAPINA